MSRPIRNPFYWLLVLSCACLLGTMFVYLVGWFYVPHPDRPGPAVPMPPWMLWIDRRALPLLVAEVAAVVACAILTISLDRFFEPKGERGKVSESS